MKPHGANMTPERLILRLLPGLLAGLICLAPGLASAGEADLGALVDEALRNNPELQSAQAQVESGRHRVPQASALPDPSVSLGYTNEGLQKYTYGNSFDSVWAVTFSQPVPFPGKLVQKSRVAGRDVDVLQAQLGSLRLQTAAKVKEIYFDLFLAHRTLAILQDKMGLLEQAEKAALARYASGLGEQRDAVTAQTEKYLVLERLEMARQKIHALEGQLNAQLGREVMTPVAEPAEPPKAPYGKSLEELLAKASLDSPDVVTDQKRLERAQTKVSAAKQEFFPDVTLSVGYANKGFKASQAPPATDPNTSGPSGQAQRWTDMWSAGVSVSIPLYFWTKQAEGLKESKSDLYAAQRDLENVKNMTASAIRENYTALKAAERLADLYASGTIPKTRQDVQLALADYGAGKGDMAGVVLRLRGLLDSEVQYWTQLVEKNKAEARLESLVGSAEGIRAASAALVRAPQPGATAASGEDTQHSINHPTNK